MTTKYLSKAVDLLTAVVLTGCSSDDSTQSTNNTNDNVKGLTEFATIEETVDTEGAQGTRTTGEYSGSVIKFYWTSNDNIWVKPSAGALIASKHLSIPAPNTKENTAKFWFDESLSEETYPVRYTGTGNNSSDKVTIKAT